MSNEIKMGDKIEFTVVQLVLFLSNFLDYLASQPETWGGISAGGMAEARDFVVEEIERREIGKKVRGEE